MRNAIFRPISHSVFRSRCVVGGNIREEDICLIVRGRNDKPISRNTLRKHFKKELESGATKLTAEVGNFMVATIFGHEMPEGWKGTLITDEKVRGQLLQLFAKARMGWRETALHQHERKDGAREIVFQVVKGDADADV